MVRVLIPLLLIALIYAQTYYLSYGVVVELQQGWWDGKAKAFLQGPTPWAEEVYRVKAYSLLNNTTATLFLPVEEAEVLVGPGEIKEGLLRIVVEGKGEKVVILKASSVGKPLAYAGVLDAPPKKEEPKVEVEVIERREERESKANASPIREEERERVQEVLTVTASSRGLNLPPLGDVLLLILIAGLLTALSLIMRHYHPKERKGREPINPYMYEVEFKKPPKVE